MRKHITAVLWLYTAHGIAAAFPFIISPLIVRVGGIEYYGSYIELVTAAQFSAIFSEFGFEIFGPRKLILNSSPPNGWEANVYANVLYSKLLIILPSSLISTVALSYFTEQSNLLIDWIGIAMWQLGFAMQATWWCVSTNYSRGLARYSIYGRLISFALILYFLFSNLDPLYLFLSTGFGYLFTGTLVITRLIGYSKMPRPSWNSCVADLRAALPVFTPIFLSTLLNLSGQMAAVIIIGTRGAGIYSSIDKIVRVVSTGLKPIFQVLYPNSIRWVSGEKSNKNVVFAIVFFIWGLFTALALILTSQFSDKLFKLLYDQTFPETGILFSSLVSWLCLGIMNNLIGIQLLLSRGRHRIYNLSISLGFIITMLGFVALHYVGASIQYFGAPIVIGEAVIAFSLLLFGRKYFPWRE